MDPFTTTAASGLRSRIEALDLVANNLANSGAAGFKADRHSFSTYVADEASVPDRLSGAALAPVIEKNWTDFRQGEVRYTGNSSDVALSGPGFFEVQGPGGPLLTRGGTITVQNNGRLTTAQGHELRSVDGRPIVADPTRALQIQADGSVEQGGMAIGRLKVVQPADAGELRRREGLYFELDTQAYQRLTPSNASVIQGATEASNLGSAESAARMITVLRQFEALQRAMQIGSEMGRRVTEDVARVQG